ncbi:ABC transporter ATP-binding protein [Paenibacillus castaneae]|uniref:ABC transporter ATP-binding protein n=1 Tax=Paenibacillus castaneae TaxID=474957 RepID=UPI000C99E417|nr:ABC transporter ATP-binding protein [Paenibacillus castaneae]
MLKLFRDLRTYWIMIAFVFLLVFLQSLSELYLPTLMADIVNIGIGKGDTNYIVKIGGLMLLITAASVVFSIAASYYSSTIAAGFGKRIRRKLFNHVEHFSLNEFDKIGTASLITRTTNDVTQVQQVLIMMLRMMVMAPMMCIGGIIMAVSKDATLSLVFVVVIPVLAATIIFIGSKGVVLFKAMQIKVDKLNLVLRENLTGIRVIRSFNRTGFEQRRFDATNKDLTQTAIKVNKVMAFMMPIMMLILNLSSVAILWFGSIRIGNEDMQIGDLMAFLQYAMQILFSLIMVAMMFIMVPRASVSAVRINEVIEMKPDIVDAEETSGLAAGSGFVEFREVTFSYPGAEKPALSAISFTAMNGETTAIIGGTGSGKSTLVNLIPRFYDIQSGSVLINDVDVRNLSQQSLREKIGYVPQQAVLFTGTISENIRYGKEDATEEEISHAAEVAQAASFISEMLDGYQSIIAQGGTNVSGGQKQRLSIARALVRQADIYIFDDSFSALDLKTDALLRAALKEETKQSAVIIVAQRVSTVIHADKIIVLDEGEIAGMGTHSELMQSCSVYREIVSSQLSEEEIA